MSKRRNSTQSIAHPSPRDYQDGFYKSSSKVRDRESRLRKAEKITFALTELAGYELANGTGLDLGCSSGVITHAIAPLFGQTIGLDYDSEALKNVDRSAGVIASFLRSDAMGLPLASSSVDVIVCAQVYEHVPDDQLMVSEMFRVLRPGGLVFFSGPNRLYPIEPHYFLPFLHWLPSKIAGAYLRLFGRGDQYYERPRSFWSLRRLLIQFRIHDITPQILLWWSEQRLPRALSRILHRVPPVLWRPLQPLYPNFNWILRKPVHTEDPRH